MIPDNPPHLPSPIGESGDEARTTTRARDARAYARLLVSDVRLYHEEDVVSGRLACDLAARLEKPIASARERYRRRFSGWREDAIFEDEVRLVLAGSDAHRMG